MVVWALVALSCLLLGCSRTCTAEKRSGFDLEVTDARTGLIICSPMVVIRDGDFELRPRPECYIRGPEERPGTYSVETSLDGYQTDRRTVEVGGLDECDHVPHTIHLSIELQPLPTAPDGGSD